ncbi:MAG TPA: acyltransferase [Ktedonobacteraceae bacterium]|jgi:peptidoglycan/LPS O-acetylase OafA/YrhL|nr:acyltransferase [Ktedonobacteraceae bacterium]
MGKELQARRPHVYELDPLRAITAFCVVAVHAVALTTFLNHTSVGTQIQNALVVALHFTREEFIFVTAFALIYVYYGRPFDITKFWGKRSVGVLLPYCIWSAIYVAVNVPGQAPLQYIQTTLIDIVSGNASFQLYYILLTLQFYIIFPLFLLFMKRVAGYPWRVLSISFLLEVLLLYADYRWVQQGTLAATGFWQFFAEYQNRFILIYQFYFVLGGFTALYFQQVRSFLLRNGWLIATGFLAAIAVLWLHFLLQLQVYQDSMGYATSVLQPIMAFYSLAVILFSFWLVCCWASRRQKDNHPRAHRTWQVLSDASFGVYLIHVLFLTAILKWVLPAMPAVWPIAVRVFLTWFLTAASATTATVILLYIPGLSRLVGRAQPSSKKLDSKPIQTPMGDSAEQSGTCTRSLRPPLIDRPFGRIYATLTSKGTFKERLQPATMIHSKPPEQPLPGVLASKQEGGGH